MENFYFTGVDVSKKKLDFCVMFEGKVVHEEETANHQSAIMSLLHHFEEDYGIDNTGQYTFPLACACKTVECKLWLENAAEIKYSSGVQGGVRMTRWMPSVLLSMPADFRIRYAITSIPQRILKG